MSDTDRIDWRNREHWKGGVVVVTGASSGIGRETALAFARQGCLVLVAARREDRLRELVERCREWSPDSSHLAGDLGRRDFAEQLIEVAVRRYGRLDVLVNNAATPCHESIYEIDVDTAERVMRVNFFSCLWTTFAAMPHMLRLGGGHVVNVSSFASRLVPPYETLYAASKCAMNGFTEGLWNDLAGSGIHASLVLPGPFETEIWGKLQRPSRYAGRRHPPSLVVDCIFECIEKRLHERVVPRRDPMLTLARWVRLLAPGLARKGAARMDPFDPEALEAARARALSSLPGGPESS